MLEHGTPEETTIDTDAPTLRAGIESELPGPTGSDRQVLADVLAARCGGRVLRSFPTDGEPSAVPDVGAFGHLPPASDVVDGQGRPVARLVGHVTIGTDLVPSPLADGQRPVADLSGVRSDLLHGSSSSCGDGISPRVRSPRPGADAAHAPASSSHARAAVTPETAR